MRYLLIKEEEIAGQLDTTYKPRTPDGRIILTEGEAKALDNFSAQFVTAATLRVILDTPVEEPTEDAEVPETPAEEPEDVDPGFSVTPPAEEDDDNGVEDVEPAEGPEESGNEEQNVEPLKEE